MTSFCSGIPSAQGQERILQPDIKMDAHQLRDVIGRASCCNWGRLRSVHLSLSLSLWLQTQIPHHLLMVWCFKGERQETERPVVWQLESASLVSLSICLTPALRLITGSRQGAKEGHPCG